MQNNINTWGHREKTALQMHDGTKNPSARFFLNIGNDAPRHNHSTFVSLRLTSLRVCLHAGLRSTCTKNGFVMKMPSKVVCFNSFLASGDLSRLLINLNTNSMRGSRGGRGQGSQSYQTSFQCSAIIGPPAKRLLNGVSLAGR